MQKQTLQQHFFMQRAIELGERGKTTSPPDPWVGAVVVKEGQIVGEGYHSAPNALHAEIEALNNAGKRAEGATLYISLEPCSHYGSTPPCVEAIIEAKIKEVVIPLLDPDKNGCGSGVLALRQAGIEVTTGLLEKQARHSLASYIHHRQTGRPWVILQTAISLDGKVAAEDGSSKWITGEAARNDAQNLRVASQAILIGTKTALIDSPHLTVRIKTPSNFKPPLRVVLDSKGVVPLSASLFDLSAPTLVCGGPDFDEKKKWELLDRGIEFELLPLEKEELSIDALLKVLGKRGVLQLLVEGGSHLHTSFFAKGKFNQLTVYVGAALIGNRGKSMLELHGCHSIDEAVRLKLVQATPLDEDVRLDYVPDATLASSFLT